MFIPKKPPVRFLPNEILSPEAINENNGHFTKAFGQQVDAQNCHWSTTYCIVPNASTTLTAITPNLSSYGARLAPTAAFRAINSNPDVVIESVTINTYYTSTVPWSITIAGGEVITFPVRDASLALEPYLGGNFVTLMNRLCTGVVIDVTSLPGGVSITKLDITVGFRSDKYASGNYTSAVLKPNLNLPYFTDASVADATVFAAMKTQLETSATGAVAGIPFRWICAEFNNITSGSNANLRFRAIPSFLDPAIAISGVGTNLRIIGVYTVGSVTGGTIGDTIQFGLATAAGAFVVNLSPTYVGGAGTYGFTNGNIATLANSVALTAASSLPADDRYIQITITGTATLTTGTVYLLVQ